MPPRDDVHSPFSVYDVSGGGGVRSQMVRAAFLPLMRGVFASLAKTSDSRMGEVFFRRWIRSLGRVFGGGGEHILISRPRWSRRSKICVRAKSSWLLLLNLAKCNILASSHGLVSSAGKVLRKHEQKLPIPVSTISGFHWKGYSAVQICL